MNGPLFHPPLPSPTYLRRFAAESFTIPRNRYITNFLENDVTLEAAQRIAGHADSRTTKLYDRRGQKVLLEDMERIRY
jgi:hypothetical protein